MTVEQRLEQVEQQNQKMQRQNQRIQRTNKRMMVALTMTVVAMAATGEKRGGFDEVTARHINVINDADKVAVTLGATYAGDGLVQTWSAKGQRVGEVVCDSGRQRQRHDLSAQRQKAGDAEFDRERRRGLGLQQDGRIHRPDGC